MTEKRKYEQLGGLPNPGEAPRTPIKEREDRAEIEFELATGKSVRQIARKFNVHEQALYKHRKKLPPQLKAAFVGHLLKPGEDLETIRVEESSALLKRVAQQQARIVYMQDKAMAADDHKSVASLANAFFKGSELIGRLVGELNAHAQKTTINILASPDYLRLRTALVRALQPYPDAARAVSEALYKAESSAARDIASPPTIDVTPALPAPDDGEA
jgi:transposase-like protein